MCFPAVQPHRTTVPGALFAPLAWGATSAHTVRLHGGTCACHKGSFTLDMLSILQTSIDGVLFCPGSGKQFKLDKLWASKKEANCLEVGLFTLLIGNAKCCPCWCYLSTDCDNSGHGCEKLTYWWFVVTCATVGDMVGTSVHPLS